MGLSEGPSPWCRTTAPCRTHSKWSVWALAVDITEPTRTGLVFLSASVISFVSTAPQGSNRPYLTLKPASNQQINPVCPAHSQHAPQPHSYQKAWKNRAAGPYTPSRSSIYRAHTAFPIRTMVLGSWTTSSPWQHAQEERRPLSRSEIV